MNDPVLTKRWGCEEPSQKFTKGAWVEYPCFEIVVDGTLYSFYRHPQLYLSPAILSEVAEINYNNDNSITKPYHDVSARYMQIKRLYDMAINAGIKLKEVVNGSK